MKVAIVTATTLPERASACVQTWGINPTLPCVAVINGPQVEKADGFGFVKDGLTVLLKKEYLGSVPAFHYGVDWALAHTDADIIACLHDDLEIHAPNWAHTVVRHFERHPACGLAGFGGALGIGDLDIYTKPYAPVQLARTHFRSNLVDAETHGIRSLVAEPVACLDGFSQIGRRAFWEGIKRSAVEPHEAEALHAQPLRALDRLGMKHHAYDTALGVLAFVLNWEVWYLPVRCHHLGGQTAVGDPGYQEWAKRQTAGIGDQAFWVQAHEALYELGRGILPIRV